MANGFHVRVPLVDGDFFVQRPGYLPNQFCVSRYHNTRQLRKAEVVSSNARCTYKPFYYHWLSLSLVVALVCLGLKLP